MSITQRNKLIILLLCISILAFTSIMIVTGKKSISSILFSSFYGLMGCYLVVPKRRKKISLNVPSILNIRLGWTAKCKANAETRVLLPLFCYYVFMVLINSNISLFRFSLIIAIVFITLYGMAFHNHQTISFSESFFCTPNTRINYEQIKRWQIIPTKKDHYILEFNTGKEFFSLKLNEQEHQILTTNISKFSV